MRRVWNQVVPVPTSEERGTVLRLLQSWCFSQPLHWIVDTVRRSENTEPGTTVQYRSPHLFSHHLGNCGVWLWVAVPTRFIEGLKNASRHHGVIHKVVRPGCPLRRMILIPSVEIHPVMTRIIKPARTCLERARVGWAAFPVGGHQPIRHVFLETFDNCVSLRSIYAVISQREIDVRVLLVATAPEFTPLTHLINSMLRRIEAELPGIVTDTIRVQE